MQPVKTVSGTAVVLRRSDVDTDQIIPSDWLKRVQRTGFAEGLFSQWREDPDFVLNQPAAAEASILLAGSNFGTGSSREHAVWALEDFGFRVIVSPRFADIFRGNCTKVGLLPVELPEAVVGALMDAVDRDPATLITVDLEACRVSCGAASVDEPFAIDAFTRWRLIEGLDDIGITLQHGEAITAFEAGRHDWLPRVKPGG
jgi:3-isopropylmalate/(R)-2-methylmalate dehydratase small subunit